jgi:hypothetical protein
VDDVEDTILRHRCDPTGNGAMVVRTSADRVTHRNFICDDNDVLDRGAKLDQFGAAVSFALVEIARLDLQRLQATYAGARRDLGRTTKPPIVALIANGWPCIDRPCAATT